jgi:hypothetical protein
MTAKTKLNEETIPVRNHEGTIIGHVVKDRFVSTTFARVLASNLEAAAWNRVAIQSRAR